MEMKTYRCDNPAEIHWSNCKYLKIEKKPDHLVDEFKSNPDSFFAPIVPPTKPKSN
jgi:hypothetical protein